MGRTRELNYGCIRFDDTHEHNRGWASIAGKKAFRIGSTRDLSSDVIWLHNLDYEMTYAAGMENHAGLRRNNYLSEDFIKNKEKTGNASINEDDVPYEIVSLLGANPKDGSQQTVRMAALFDRIMTVAEHFGINGAPAGQLQSGLRDLLFSYDPVLPKNVVDAIDDATVHHVNAEREPLYHGTVSRMVLSMPKVSHGVRCANVFLPIGNWREVKAPATGQERIDEWIKEIGVYSLVQCSIENVNEEAHKLFNYGSGRKARRWLTGIELILLNKFADIMIRKAYQPSDIREIELLQPLLEQHDPIHELSLSMGFFWQNIWLGIGTKKPPPPHIRKNRPTINPLTPFVKAIDRNECFLAALMLQTCGVIVSGYGKGKIHILHDGDNDRLAEACREARVIPPFLKTKPRDDVGQTEISMLQEIYIQGDYDQLESADKQIVEHICQ